jgi:hypothetical protein
VAQTYWVVEYVADAYRFGRIRLDDCLTEVSAPDPSDPSAVVEAMRSAGYVNQPVLFAVPSDWCLCATVALSNRRLLRNRQALAYALEEQLPLAAEDMVCDFVTHESSVFGVAIDLSILLPVVRALEEAGLAVTTISPSALLILRQLMSQIAQPANGPIVMVRRDQCDFFLVSSKRPTQWRNIRADHVELRREITAHRLLHPTTT